MLTKGKMMVKTLKVAGWTILSFILLIALLLFCAVKFINSKELSHMIEDVANDYIDGHLSIGDVKLGFRPGFPILGVEVDNLSLISHAFDSLDAEQRGLLPNYSDSLISLDKFTGALNLKRLIVNNELVMHDVVLNGLKVNLVIAHNGKANYEVAKIPDDTLKTKKNKMPGFSIDRFALDRPKEIRFYNASDSTSASVLLLTDAAVDGNDMPTYRLKINGNVTSPKATLITNLEKINFGMNGTVNWDPADPGLVAIDNMEIQGEFLKAIVGGEIDLKESPIVKKGVVDIDPLPIADILSLLPDSIKEEHRLYEPYFSTNASISGRFELTKPMNLATDTVPDAMIKFSIPPSDIKYGNAHFEQFAIDATIRTFTNLPDETTVDVSRFSVKGESADLEAKASISSLLSDPSFDAFVQGTLNLKKLPPIVQEKIPGYLSGNISTDLHANGTVSMFSRQHFHRLVADGSINARDIYFLTGDTSKLVQLGNVNIDLDSKRIVEGIPLLRSKVDVDTATILVSGVDIAIGKLSLGASVENTGQHADSSLMLPVGGNLKVDRLNIVSITDSAGARMRNINGKIKLLRKNKENPILEILADIVPTYVSAGTLSDRLLLNDTKVKASLTKLPSSGKKKTESKKAPRNHHEYSYIAPATVFKYVYNKRHHRPGEKVTRRVYTTLGAKDNEILKWDLTRQFSNFLNEWRLKGTVTNTQARLLTPLFPLRNRISRIELNFNNDTVNITNISLRAGKSDLAISGRISNVRRALTSKNHDTLKGNFSILSDTIDINEISAGAFTGASYAERLRQGKIKKKGYSDDATLQSRIDALAKEGPRSASPILIPVNIDAKLRIEANRVLYSDFSLQNMGGDFLLYDGAINIHDLKACSDAGNLNVSALYSAPKLEEMQIGFGMELKDFDIAKFVELVPAIDSITPLMHDFSGFINADLAATCRIDSGMNLVLPSLNAAIRINGDNLAFIDPEKYRTLGKWLGFKNKADNTIHSLNVEMTVADGLMRVYPFAFNIDRYRLGVYGYNNIAMDFDYHLAVLKSPIPFKFGITISGNPKKYKVRFGGAKFKEDTAIESVNIVNRARINLMDQIEGVFKRGVRNSQFAKLNVARPKDFDAMPDPGLSAADSLQLIQEGLLEAPQPTIKPEPEKKPKKKHKKFLFF